MNSQHIVIYIPGLGDSRVSGQRLALKTWRPFGVAPYLFQMHWADGEAFQPKLDRLLAQIDAYNDRDYTVSLIGASAGAAAALVAYTNRATKINGVIFICGKLGGYFHPSYHQTNPAFAQSMEMLPNSLRTLRQQDKAKMLSLHPISDRIVPIQQTRIPGVTSEQMPIRGHAAGIAYGLTVRAAANIRFLKRPTT